MQTLAPFAGREPTTGLIRAARRYNTTDNPWTENEERVRWWEGINVSQTSCTGVKIRPIAPCAGGNCCDPDAAPDPTGTPCFDRQPGWVPFHQFKLEKGLCLPAVCANGVWADLRDDVRAFHMIGMERALWHGIGTNPGIITAAANLSSSGIATSLTDAIGMLLTYRGSLGVGGGVLHLPPQAMLPAAGPLAAMTAAYGQSPFNTISAGFGYSDIGPSGMPAAPGHAWLAVTGPIITAVSTEPDYDGSDTTTFTDPKTGCFTPLAAHRGIVVWNPCAAAMVLVDLREKGC